MASKQPYECFVCKNNGFPGEMVYLAGKDEQGHAIRQEADGSSHQHKNKLASQQQEQQTQPQQPTITDVLMQIKLLHQKVDKLLEVQQQQQQ